MIENLIYDYARTTRGLQVVATKEYSFEFKSLVAEYRGLYGGQRAHPKNTFEFIIRETKGAPLVTFCAGVDKETRMFYIGYSACKTTEDTFNKEEGRAGAELRMMIDDGVELQALFSTFPVSQKTALQNFLVRCEKYYQGCTVGYPYLNWIEKGESENEH
jgi:hypothetical protein